jgi:hypothetical protein
LALGFVQCSHERLSGRSDLSRVDRRVHEKLPTKSSEDPYLCAMTFGVTVQMEEFT